jgi:hypothetical protein
MTQTMIVAVLVAWAGVYAAWVLMPAPLRRGLLRLGQRHCPGLARRMAPAAEGGCGGCSGCGPAAGKKVAQGAEVKTIQLHLKRR